MESKLNLEDVVLNMKLLLASSCNSSDKKKFEIGKPDELVANWNSTRLYKKASWQGRVWQCLHMLTRSENDALKLTINKTSLAVKASVENMQKLVQDVNEAGLLGNYWKDRNVESVRSAVKQALQLQSIRDEVSEHALKNITSVVSWANNKDGDKSTLKAIKKLASDEMYQSLTVTNYKTVKAEFLAKRMAELGNVASIEVLYRELHSNYPKNDTELLQRRDALQRQTLGYNPKDAYGKETLCPEHILYAPLMALARDFAARKNISLAELEIFLSDLMMGLATDTTQHNIQLLLEMIKYLRDQNNAPQAKIPSSLLESMKDAFWVKHCTTNKTEANWFIRCERGQHKEYRTVPTGFTQKMFGGPSFTHYAPARLIPHTVHTHHKQYYYFEKLQNGSERIGVETKVTPY